MADEPPQPDVTWQELCLLISSPDGVDYSTAANQQPGISTQLRVDLDKFRTVISTSRLDFVAVQTRAAALRTSASVNSPGDAIIALARQAIPVLENVTHALFHAFLSRDYQNATLMDGVIMIHISEIVTSPAPQYLDCTSPQPAQQIKYLGHVVTADTVMPDPYKVEQLFAAPSPANTAAATAFFTAGSATVSASGLFPYRPGASTDSHAEPMQLGDDTDPGADSGSGLL
eukprot:jgi/Ulvmu1/11997/UM083_0007.1